MQSKIEQLFLELRKYEKGGTDSMEWAEYAAEFIDRDIIDTLSKDDWHELERTWEKESIGVKTLLANHMDLGRLEIADFPLRILTKMIHDESSNLAIEALRHLTFHFVTSGIDYTDEISVYYSEKNIKGIFVSEASEVLIDQYINTALLERARQLSLKCSEQLQLEINKFINVIETKDFVAN